MDEREQMRKWVETWRTAAPKLEAIRQRELCEADNKKVIAQLEGAFNQAIHTTPPRTTSGLVEMQHSFAKLRK
jgi:hypothetical protein